MKEKIFLFFLIFLLTLPLSSYKKVYASTAPIVTAIEVKGLKRIEEGAILKRIRQKIGQPLSRQKISKDIKNIYNMGYFEDVKVEVEPYEGGLKVIYVLKEKPTISRIFFSGNHEFDDTKLSKQLTITPGAIADVTLIQRNVSALKNFYESEGYWSAQVVPIVKEVSDSEVTLTFLINEGSKVRIKDIEFIGNSKISDSKIKHVMETKSWWIFSFITSSGYYKKSVMKQDIERIKNLYYNNGFLNVVVSDPEIILTKDRKKMLIKIRISEGPQYRISEIKFRAHAPSDEPRLKEMLPLKKGDIFSKKLLQEGIRKITEFYSERGYALATVEPEVIPDEATKTVKLVMNVNEGDIYRVGRIEIIGNTKTQDKVIRREMRLDEGDIFNSKLLQRSYERINNLNFFESVKLVPKPRVKEKKLDIDIKVKEKATGFLSVGGGYSSIDKFVAMIDVTQANLFGTGRYLKLRGEFGGRSTFYELSYRDPWFMDKPLSFSVSLYKTRRDYLAYDREATGGTIGFGKRFREYWHASATYKYEKVTISNIDEGASSIVKDQEGTNVTSSITPAISRDTRDNYLDPHRGSKNSLYITYAGLGGNNFFIKGLFDSSWFFPIGETTFAARGRIGYATGLFNHKLPLYERFYVGGLYTIRGLGFGEGGPKDDNGDPIGGTKEVIVNLEYIFPLITELKLKGVVFFDSGRAYDTSETFGTDLRYTTGAGVRWMSPFGPIRIEYGYNLDRREDEDQGKIEFSFGGYF